MKRLIANHITNNYTNTNYIDTDCMNIITDFLNNHISNYDIVNFNAYTENDTTEITCNVKISDNITINFYFVCQYNKIISYDIYVNGENPTIEQAQKVYELNNKINEYIEQKI